MIQYYSFYPYSRVESKSKSKEGHSIYTIAGEADRLQGFTDHVKEPKKTDILYGSSFSDVVKLAEEYAEKTIDSCGRAVRKNGLCAIFGVISAPPDMSEKVWKEYKKDSIQYLKDTWGKNGARLSIIEHTDEPFDQTTIDEYNSKNEQKIKSGTLHRHIHFGVVPKIGVNLAEIHPGIKAKRNADKAYGISKKPEEMSDEEFRIFKKDGRKTGDLAYRNAMKMVQDDFFCKVSDKYGLLRYGPKRSRLTRDEVKKRMQEKRLKQKDIVTSVEQQEKIKEQEAEIKEAQKELEKVKSDKLKIETKLKEQDKTISAREKAVEKREISVADREKQNNDFETGKKTSLKGWQMPKPKLFESAVNYIERVSGEVMGIVVRAMKTIKSYTQKKAELDEERKAFEQEKLLAEKREAAKIATKTKVQNETIKRLIANYETLKKKLLGIKTMQDVTVLQRDLSYQRKI